MPKQSYNQRNQHVDHQYNAGRDNHIDQQYHYDHRIGQQYNHTHAGDTLGYAFAVGGCISKGLMILGAVVGIVGFAVWAGVIFSFWASIPGSESLNSYGIPALPLIPWAPIGFGLFGFGGILLSVGKTIAESRGYRPK